MLRISFTIFLALTAWIHPASAISAYAEPQLENPQFINYELHRENLKSIRDEQKTDDGQRLLQPQQNLLKADHTKTKNGSRDLAGTKRKENSQPIQNSGRNYSKEEVIQLIENYLREYRIESLAPLCIAKLESGYNQFSKNKSSSASGVFQYLGSTWKATDEGRVGRSVWDADANVKAAIKYMSSRRNAKPWTVATSCPPIKTIN